ncbi:hypothetical protein P3T27_006194 [Kitasatospora sp. MAA19]|uniref:NADH oxidase n=1 Tax=Kitasatospora sp. MAA19 TaxID=3035090 RepID=UPI00247547EF|nr:NADH oxidase [Kitasatospora sp. MAA19]MDH6709448.1 hypothetical protein [Kitasatospora sp. MAA19]
MDECPVVHLWSLAEDVAVHPGALDGELVLVGLFGTEHIKDEPLVVAEALRRMELGPVLLTNVEAGSDSGLSPDEVQSALSRVLKRIPHLVVCTLGVDDLRGPLLSVVPLVPTALLAVARLPARSRLQLPRGASFTVDGNRIVLRRKGAAYRVELHRPEAAWVVARLAWPTTPDAVSRELPLPWSVTRSILEYLVAAGMLTHIRDAAPGSPSRPASPED